MTSSASGAGRWLVIAALLLTAGCAGYKGAVVVGETDRAASHPLIVTLPSTSRSLVEITRQASLDTDWPLQGRLNKGLSFSGALPGGSPMALGGPCAICE